MRPRQTSLLEAIWVPVLDGDPTALSLIERHYSFRHYRDGRPRTLFVGPGQKMVLVTPDASAVFVWRKFLSDDHQQGINCSAFPNEGSERSSDLIRAADQLAFERWPGERHYTYVNPRRIRSTNPGYCFLMAGWRKCGRTKKCGFLILEKLP